MLGDAVECILGDGQVQPLKGLASRSHGAAGGHELDEQSAGDIAVGPLVRWRQLRRAEFSAAGAWDLYLEGQASHVDPTVIGPIAFVAIGLLQVGAALGLEQTAQQQTQQVPRGELIQAAAGKGVLDGLVQFGRWIGGLGLHRALRG